MGADTKTNTLAAAYLRVVICVSVRTAASAEAPLSPIPLPKRLQSMGEVGAVRDQACQWALTQKRTRSSGGALQGGDLRLLEDGGERGGTLVSDMVVRDAASEGHGWER